MKKLTILGGGTGMSQLLKGLKKFPFDISAIVAVSDDGKSTGRLRAEFNIPALGDLRKVLVSLSEKEEIAEKLLDYRFKTSSDLDGHAVGNLLLAALTDINGSISLGIADLDDVLNLKGKVIPLTEDNVTLVGKMEDGTVIKGEHNITEDKRKIKEIYYEENPEINDMALNAIKEADVIVLSSGSLYTSIIPNLLCESVKNEIDKSSAKIIYVCNIMTQPGETDGLTVSKHLEILNNYLGKRKIDVVLVNNGKISNEALLKYKDSEAKEPTVIDVKEIKKLGVKIIEDNLVTLDNGVLRHNSIRVALNIYSCLLDK